MKLAESLEKFIEYLKIRNYSTRSLKEYRSCVSLFHEYLREQEITEPTTIARDTVYQYQHHLYSRHAKRPSKHPLAITTQHKNLTVIKTYLSFLVKHNYLLYNPAFDLEMPKLPNQLPKNILTRNEIKKLFKATDLSTPLGFRDRIALELLYATGMRQGELLNLKLYDIDLDNREIRITKGKGNKDRVVPIAEKSGYYLSEYIHTQRPRIYAKDSNFLLVTRNGTPMRPGQLQGRLKRLITRAGLTKKVTCHTFRHTCATHLLKGRASLRHIQKILGHQSLATTQKYTHLELTDLKRIIKKTHPREKMIC